MSPPVTNNVSVGPVVRIRVGWPLSFIIVVVIVYMLFVYRYASTGCATHPTYIEYVPWHQSAERGLKSLQGT